MYSRYLKRKIGNDKEIFIAKTAVLHYKINNLIILS